MVKGTGADDRVTSKDVEMFAAAGPPAAAVAAAAAPAAAPMAAAPPPGMPAAAYEDIPLTNVRQVSDRLRDSFFCSMRSMLVGVHNIFHGMSPFRPVRHPFI